MALDDEELVEPREGEAGDANGRHRELFRGRVVGDPTAPRWRFQCSCTHSTGRGDTFAFQTLLISTAHCLCSRPRARLLANPTLCACM